MFRHLRDRVRSFSSGRANAHIVKENYLMISSKAVGYVRIPAVHVGVEVPHKKQRNRTRFAESAIGETDAIGLNKLCRDRFVCVIAHRLASFQSDVLLAVLRVEGQHLPPSVIQKRRYVDSVSTAGVFSALCCSQ